MPDQRRTGKKLTEKEIVAESEVTAADVEDARKWWKSHAPAQYKQLLDATEQPDGK